MVSKEAIEDALKDAQGVRHWMDKVIAQMETPAVTEDRKDSHLLALKLGQLARGVETICEALLKQG